VACSTLDTERRRYRLTGDDGTAALTGSMGWPCSVRANIGVDGQMAGAPGQRSGQMRERSSTVEREMRAAPADIWAYRLDFRNLPGYNPNVTNLERTTEGGKDGVGAIYRFDLHGPAGTFPIEIEVTRTEPDRVVAIDMRGTLPAAEVFTVEPLADRGGSPRSSVAVALTLRIPDEFPPAGDDGMLSGGVRQLEDELDAMADALVARAPR
jgi:polyketide cyclase/dehydrase/lipid transport protein